VKEEIREILRVLDERRAGWGKKPCFVRRYFVSVLAKSALILRRSSAVSMMHAGS